MSVQNCWEVKKCGRERGGFRVSELGVCPASTETRTNGLHHGINGGRACWAVTGTFCGGKVQGAFAAKLTSCMDCQFYKQVSEEEVGNYQHARAILALLK